MENRRNLFWTGSNDSWQMIYKNLYLDENVNIFQIVCGFLFLCKGNLRRLAYWAFCQID